MIQFLHRSKNEFQNWIFVMKFPTISTWHLSNTIFHGKRRYCVSREISLPFYRGISEQHIPINAQIQCSKIDRLKAIECILWASKVEQNENNQMDIKKFQKSNKKHITNFHSNLQCMRSSNSDKKLTSTVEWWQWYRIWWNLNIQTQKNVWINFDNILNDWTKMKHILRYTMEKLSYFDQLLNL